MRFIKIILTTLVIVIVIVIVIFAVGLWNFRKKTYYSAGKIYENFNLAANALKNLETREAQQRFWLVKQQLNQVIDDLRRWRIFLPSLKKFSQPLQQVGSVAEASLQLTKELDFLKNNVLQLIIQKEGALLVNSLKKIQTALDTLAPLVDQEQIYTAKNLLSALIVWLDDPVPKNLVILFQNPSEIRPGGGFIGSFTDITLEKGGLAGLEVQDIYDVDGQLTVKVPAPEPLEKITTYWGARDANWFFDFPASARKVLEFLELSKIYQERAVKFSGAIAINYRVIEDLLRIIGPIVIDDLKLGADNFLFVIQEEVETEQNKDILKKLTPFVFEKLNQLSGGDKKQLLEIFRRRFANKDIMVYVDNPLMQNYLVQLGVAGEQFVPPSPPAGGFVGDYLAVVNANIGGGKSDAFVKQKIKLVSQVQRDGTIENKLTIRRQHQGQQREEKWYNTVNKNYLQVLTPEPVYADWFDIPTGETRRLILNYKKQLPLTSDFQPPTSYTFVFDKQSGVDGPLEIVIKAPAGLVWQENGDDVFVYKTANPPARVTISLTLP